MEKLILILSNNYIIISIICTMLNIVSIFKDSIFCWIMEVLTIVLWAVTFAARLSFIKSYTMTQLCVTLFLIMLELLLMYAVRIVEHYFIG